MRRSPVAVINLLKAYPASNIFLHPLRHFSLGEAKPYSALFKTKYTDAMNTGTARHKSYKPAGEVDVENILKEASIGLRNLLEVDNSEKSSIKRMV